MLPLCWKSLASFPDVPLPLPSKSDIRPQMMETVTRKPIFVLQDRKRLPARFFAELSGLATAHL